MKHLSASEGSQSMSSDFWATKEFQSKTFSNLFVFYYYIMFNYFIELHSSITGTEFLKNKS